MDLIFRGDTEYARIAFERRRSYDLFGQRISVIAPEDLILAKFNWASDSHSELQLNDVRAVLCSEELDTAYLENWIQKLKLDAIWRTVRP